MLQKLHTPSIFKGRSGSVNNPRALFVPLFMIQRTCRSSSRMYNMVCTPEVWRRLLKGIEEFTDAKVLIKC